MKIQIMSVFKTTHSWFENISVLTTHAQCTCVELHKNISKTEIKIIFVGSTG